MMDGLYIYQARHIRGQRANSRNTGFYIRLYKITITIPFTLYEQLLGTNDKDPPRRFYMPTPESFR